MGPSQRIEGIAETFARVMDENSKRNYDVNDTRAKTNTEVAAALARLSALIETRG